MLGPCWNSEEGLGVQKLGKWSPHSLDKLVNALSPDGEHNVLMSLGILRGQIAGK